MPLVAGVDTYADLIAADAYAAARPEWTAWANATDATKEAKLTEALLYLDASYAWKGSIADLAQPLAWPRQDVTDKEGRTVSGVPSAVETAQIELANMALASSLVASASSGELSSLTAGSVSLSFKDGNTAKEDAKFKWIDRILGGLFETRSGQTRTILNAPIERA